MEQREVMNEGRKEVMNEGRKERREGRSRKLRRKDISAFFHMLYVGIFSIYFMFAPWNSLEPPYVSDRAEGAIAGGVWGFP